MHKSLQDFDSLSGSAFVRMPTVATLFACSHATIWRGVRDGRIPKPVKHFERASAWNVAELRAALPQQTVKP